MEPPLEFMKNILKGIIIVTMLILYTGPVLSFIHKGLSSTPNTPDKILFTLNSSGILNNRSVATASVLTATAPLPHTISYTDAGFSPREYEAYAGEEITFINRSDRAMRVAIEPVDSTKDINTTTESTSVGSGGIYTVTLGSLGDFRFYNLNAKEDTGVIMVR